MVNYFGKPQSKHQFYWVDSALVEPPTKFQHLMHAPDTCKQPHHTPKSVHMHYRYACRICARYVPYKSSDKNKLEPYSDTSWVWSDSLWVRRSERIKFLGTVLYVQTRSIKLKPIVLMTLNRQSFLPAITFFLLSLSLPLVPSQASSTTAKATRTTQTSTKAALTGDEHKYNNGQYATKRGHYHLKSSDMFLLIN